MNCCQNKNLSGCRKFFLPMHVNFNIIVACSIYAEKFEGVISKIADLRIDMVQSRLIRPKAYKLLGANDLCSMTWKDFFCS